jgi:cell division protein FtsB
MVYNNIVSTTWSLWKNKTVILFFNSLKDLYNPIAITAYGEKMKFGRPKITTMLIVFALIIYGGVMLISIQTATIEGEDINRRLALEAAKLEVEVAELEFAIGRYMAYETQRMNIENLRNEEASIEERILELERAAEDTEVREVNEAGLVILKRSREEIEADIGRAYIELLRLQSELEQAVAHFNAIDASSVIAEIAREHLGLVLPGEIILHDSGN